MFTDTEISIREVGQLAPKLSDLGIKSVATHLDFKPSVVKALSDKNLLSVVLEEIDRRNQNELCVFRSYNDTPVGIPTGISSVELNEFFDRHVEFTGQLEHPFTTSVFTKKVDTDIELLQNDIFNVNYSARISILADKVIQGIKLFRQECSNGAFVVDKSFTFKSTIAGFDPQFEKFEDGRTDIIEKIRQSLSIIAGRKVNVLDLKIVSDVAGALKSRILREFLKEARAKILNAYELPMFLPKGFGEDESDEEDYSLDLFKLPKSWKKTAVIEDTSVYDIWNLMTRNVTDAEELKSLTTEDILKAHIKVARILKPRKDEDTIIAKKRNS